MHKTMTHLSIIEYKNWILKLKDTHNDDMCPFDYALNNKFHHCNKYPLQAPLNALGGGGGE